MRTISNHTQRGIRPSVLARAGQRQGAAHHDDADALGINPLGSATSHSPHIRVEQCLTLVLALSAGPLPKRYARCGMGRCRRVEYRVEAGGELW
jgi:hypothetical protein